MFYRDSIHGKALASFPRKMERLIAIIREKKADKDYPKDVLQAAETVYTRLKEVGYASKRNAHIYQLNDIIDRTKALLNPKNIKRKTYLESIEAYKAIAQTTYGSFSPAKRWLGIAMMGLAVAVLAGAMMILGNIPVAAFLVGGALGFAGYSIFLSGRQKSLSPAMESFAARVEENQYSIMPKV